MLYAFALVLTMLVQDISTMTYVCNPKASCGCSRQRLFKRIVGGESALHSSWGWMVSLQNKKIGHICGGSILNEWYIITGAHCVENINDLSNITICAGTTRLSDTCRQRREIQSIIRHPSFNTRTFESDIALIKVKVPFNFTDTSIARICLPNFAHHDKYPKPGTNAIAIGWGANEAGQKQDMLRQVTLRVVDRSEDTCDSMLSNSSLQLCAGAPGKDTSHGDGGGPLMVFTSSRRWELIGITSYGRSSKEYIGVYTRITAYLSWIQQYISNTSSEFSNSKFNSIIWYNGDRYEGQWKDGKMHGKGTLNFANGEQYRGDWINGKSTGHGTYTWPNGNRYEGQFEYNKMHGMGKMTYANGNIKHGRWSNNVFAR